VLLPNVGVALLCAALGAASAGFGSWAVSRLVGTVVLVAAAIVALAVVAGLSTFIAIELAVVGAAFSGLGWFSAVLFGNLVAQISDEK
jgi:drug/metabolite transporter superfamily protein YnfA